MTPAAERECECGVLWYWRQNKAGKWYRARVTRYISRYGRHYTVRTIMPHRCPLGSSKAVTA